MIGIKIPIFNECCMHYVGETIAKKLSLYFKSIDNLFSPKT
ncbi:MAG: hypothetical protein ACFIN1_00940 [Candidatus Walczuchella monophlebidarum]